MAECGEDIPLEPLDPDRGEDDDRHETSFGGDDWDTEHRSPGGGGSLASGSSHHFNPGYEPDEETRPLIDPVEKLVTNKDRAEDFLRSVFVDPRVDQILCGVDEYDKVWVSLTGKRATKYVHQPSGRFLSGANKEIPKSLKQLLGQTNEEALESNDQIIEQNGDTLRQLSQSRRATKEQEERVKDLEKLNKKLSKTITEKEKVMNKLRDQLEKSTSPSERKRLDEEISKVKRDLAQERSKNQNTMRENNAEIDRLRQQLEDGEDQEEVQQRIERLEAENERLGERNEEIFSRMSLRDKVKYIFKKYGLTVFGVLAAVGTVIGVIVSNLKAGLTKVAKGVGDGLKDIGKKLGQILLLVGGHATNDPSADMPVLAFGQGGAGTNHEQHPIDQSNSTINRLIIRMKKPNNDEYPRERIHIHLEILHN